MSLLEDLIRTDLDKDNFGIAVKKTDEVTKNKHKYNEKYVVIIAYYERLPSGPIFEILHNNFRLNSFNTDDWLILLFHKPKILFINSTHKWIKNDQAEPE